MLQHYWPSINWRLEDSLTNANIVMKLHQEISQITLELNQQDFSEKASPYIFLQVKLLQSSIWICERFSDPADDQHCCQDAPS